jgi:hypothetical protein
MPTIDKKWNQTKSNAATAQTDDDFDDMLAEFQTADLNAPSIAITATSMSATAIDNKVSEQTLISAVDRGDNSQLQRWAKRGVRVHSGDLLCHAAANGTAAVARCLVKELKADVNKTDTQGYTPLQ